MKGNSSCHIPNDAFREGWERIYGTRYCTVEVKEEINSVQEAIDTILNKDYGKREVEVVLPECEILHYELIDGEDE